MTARPNVLFVTLDQVRADVLLGRLAPFCPTPNLDGLMARGAVFESHFTNAVPCGPARASLLTGLHAFNHRSIRNGTPLASRHETLATLLRRAGIEPLLFGYTDAQADPTTRPPRDPDLATYENVARGFREVVEMRMEGGVAWAAHLKARGYPVPEPQPERWRELYRPTGPALSDPPLYRAEDSDTAWLTDRTIEALDIRRHRPWFAHLTYVRPHPPLVAPAPWNTIVDPALLPPPVVAAPRHPFLDAWFSEPSNRDLFWGYDGHAAGLTAATVAELRALYLGLVAEVDHHLGRLLDSLRATGQEGRTVVIVTGDHGEMLGDQGIWGKESVAAAAHHVPLIVADPEIGPIRVPAVTQAVDLAPTILARLGCEIPPQLDGIDLGPFLRHEPLPEQVALTEIDLASPGAPSRFQRHLGLDVTRCNAAVLRDARHTLVHFNGGLPEMLFDRAIDPDETTDLAADPARAGDILRLSRALIDLHMTRADRSLTEWSYGETPCR